MIITPFLSSFSFPQTSHLLTLALFKFTVSFFTSCVSMPACRPIYNLDYNLLSLRNVAHMGSFKAGLVTSQCALPWRRLIVLLQLLCRQSWWWDFIGVAADITRRHILTASPLVLWLFPSSVWKCSLSLRYWSLLYPLALGSTPLCCDCCGSLQ